MELANFDCCVACLGKGIYNSYDLTEETRNTYKWVIQQQIDLSESLHFCVNCVETLQSLLEFKQMCLDSLVTLNENLASHSVFVKVEVNTDDERDKRVEEEMIETEPIVNSIVKSVKRVRKQKESSTTTPVKKEMQPKSNKTKKIKTTETTDGTQVEPISKAGSTNSKSNQVKRRQGKYLCPICNESARVYQVHAMLHSSIDENNQHVCNLCQETSPDINGLRDHFDSHHEFDEPKKCPHCDDHFVKRYEYRNHIVHHKDPNLIGIKRVFVCDYCDSIFTHNRSFKIHVAVKHQGGAECRTCEKLFKTMEEYENHIQMEEHLTKKTKEPWFCEHCGYSTKFKTHLLRHIDQKHLAKEIPKIICNECGQSFIKKTYFKFHYFSKHRFEEHICDDCGKSFSFTKALRRHIRRVHENASAFENCKFCGKAMKKMSIQHHIQAVHLNVRNCACQICGMTFTASGILKKHMYTHSKTRPFNCNLCSTGYYSNEYLRNHFERVHGIIYTVQDIQKICGKKSYFTSKTSQQQTTMECE